MAQVGETDLWTAHRWGPTWAVVTCWWCQGAGKYWEGATFTEQGLLETWGVPVVCANCLGRKSVPILVAIP